MIDFPGVPGKMCDWQRVAAVEGAKSTLTSLSKHGAIYIATGAAESSETDIKNAFQRVGLSEFISGYFCKANLGFSKGQAGFLPAILNQLGAEKANTYMVGDNFEKDVTPALAAGIQAIWFTNQPATKVVPDKVRVISALTQLCQG